MKAKTARILIQYCELSDTNRERMQPSYKRSKFSICSNSFGVCTACGCKNDDQSKERSAKTFSANFVSNIVRWVTANLQQKMRKILNNHSVERFHHHLAEASTKQWILLPLWPKLYEKWEWWNGIWIDLYSFWIGWINHKNRRIKTSDSTNLDTFSVWVAGTTEEVILIYSKYSWNVLLFKI